MLLRVCLILAILAGIGVVVVSQTKVREHIQNTINERDDQYKRAEEALAKLARTNSALVRTTEKLRDTEKNLSDTRSTLKTADANLAEANRDKDRLLRDLDTAKQAKIDSDAKLFKFESLGMSAEQIKQTQQELKNARDQIVVTEEEKAVLMRNNLKLQQVIAEWRGTNADPVLPMALRGKVVAVDPKWEFVVLNVGERDGVLEKGVLLVHRDSKLVGKLRISKVMQDRSIANIVVGSKLTEIQEGDQVLPVQRAWTGG